MYFLKNTVGLFFIGCLTFGQLNVITAECKAGTFPENSKISISIDKNSSLVLFAVSKIEEALQELNLKPVLIDKSAATGQEQIQLNMVNQNEDTEIEREGFHIGKSDHGVVVSAIDNSGAMYGLMDLAEQIEMQRGLNGVEEKIVNPRFAFRAIKYNLPWVSYRENESLQANDEL